MWGWVVRRWASTSIAPCLPGVDARGLEAEAGRYRRAPGGREDGVDGDRAGVTGDLVDHGRLGVAVANLGDLCIQEDVDAFVAEDVEGDRRDLLVFAAEDARPLLEQAHLCAEPAVDRCELEADVSASEDREALGQRGGLEQVRARQRASALAQAGDVRDDPARCRC
jgi:hypothetical protein